MVEVEVLYVLSTKNYIHSCRGNMGLRVGLLISFYSILPQVRSTKSVFLLGDKDIMHQLHSHEPKFKLLRGRFASVRLA